MKKIRWMTALVFFAAGFLIIGELFTWHADSFETEYLSCTMYLQPGDDGEVMKQNIEDAAEAENVGVFAVVRSMENSYTEKMTIYGTDGSRKEIMERSKIREGEFRSFILGNIRIEYEDFRKIPDMDLMTEYFVAGTEDAAERFKSRLIDRYAGSYPKEGYASYEMKRTISMLWIIIDLLLILMTVYEMMLENKEMAVRMVMGEDIRVRMARRILMDTGIYSLSFAAIYGAEQQMTEAGFLLERSLAGLLVLIGLNAAVRILMGLRLTSSHLFRREGGFPCMAGSVMKFFILTILLSFVCSFVQVFMDGREYGQQEEYFRAHEDYSFVNLCICDENREACTKDLFRAADCDICCRARMDFYEEEQGRWILTQDKDLTQEEKDILGGDGDDGITVYVSTKEKPDEIRMEAEYLLKEMAGCSEEFCVKEYEENLDFLCMDGFGEKVQTEYVRNPIIVVDRHLTEHILEKGNSLFTYCPSMMLRMDRMEWERFLKEHEKSLVSESTCRTGAYERYLDEKKQQNRLMKGAAFLCILFLVIDFMATELMLELEFSFRAMEKAIRKICGASIWENYRLTIGASILPAVLCIPVSVHFMGGACGCILPVMLIAMELAAAGMKIAEMEHACITSILKGGIL